MRPALVLPMNDPAGILFPLLHVVTPTLKTIFGTAYVSIPHGTRARQPALVTGLADDPFFQRLEYTEEVPVGVDFQALYEFAAGHAPPEQLLHLCFIDRVAFALQTSHRAQFIEDISGLRATDAPLIFARSAAAWATHPRNYRQLEAMVSTTGNLLFGRDLDFCWCHVVVAAGHLRQIAPLLKQPDLRIFAALILAMIDRVQMRQVDWLAWEDPFVLGRPAAALRNEREASHAETLKRLGYVAPILQLFHETASVQ